MINYVLGVVRKQFLIHLYILHILHLHRYHRCMRPVYCAVLPLPVPAQNWPSAFIAKTPGSCAADAVNITPGRDSGDQGDNNLRFGVVTSYNALVVTWFPRWGQEADRHYFLMFFLLRQKNKKNIHSKLIDFSKIYKVWKIISWGHITEVLGFWAITMQSLRRFY